MSRPRKIVTATENGPAPSKHDRILTAAREIFMEMGYGAASMDAVAARANVSKATIYTHFDNKRDLFEQVLRGRCQCVFADADIMGDIGEAGDVRSLLRRLAGNMLEVILSPEALAINRVVVAEAPRLPEVGETFYAAGPTTAMGRLTRMFNDLSSRGLLTIPPEEAPLVAELFLNMLKGDAHMRELLKVSPRRQNHRRLIEIAVDLILARYASSDSVPTSVRVPTIPATDRNAL
ncbi:TetR/AcrR family transcriptional regulator [Telmatospirillum siberiense]|uniref:Transcriptional regulator n=1 Tax=Telmatospirillum siberiense TaxID=382514 RepID=A0A2N3Q0L9_9PROT|nr:TetR/AcrR family transcriptional regulator [Telmatospirillum siberiense]PKU26196.1 transcriptional regulator [Telmatospirillum siberiense]